MSGTVARMVGAADGVWLSGTVAGTAGAADGVWYSAALRFGVVGFGSLLFIFSGGITEHGKPGEPQMVLLKSRSISGSPGNSLDGVAVVPGSPAALKDPVRMLLVNLQSYVALDLPRRIGSDVIEDLQVRINNIAVIIQDANEDHSDNVAFEWR